ncbi:MAG: hypothetical protein HC899_05495 [Leptolyngbyaceae cyanobacterium SM1_4_3]|nr:hypothetical protein [Leptolyngbyaceae cyanobacterium SM1_4_3]
MKGDRHQDNDVAFALLLVMKGDRPFYSEQTKRSPSSALKTQNVDLKT